MPEWTPELEVPPDLVRSLLRTRFPALPAGRLEVAGEGWDNIVYRVDGQWLFRFPRRQLAVDGVHAEIATLPYLAAALPVAIPDPVFIGRPTESYPWPWFGYRALDGLEACELELDERQRTALAAPIGRLLRALHAPEHLVRLGSMLRTDPTGRSNMEDRIPRTIDRLGALHRLGLIDDPGPFEARLDPARGLSAAHVAVVHGDLHVRHLLLDKDAALAAVIDWGDVSVSDPAVDLHLYWSFLPPRARPSFLAAYGPVDDDRLSMARVIALFLSAALAVYGHETGRTALRDDALRGLRMAVAD